jgi:hypothetical protein
VAGRLSGHPVQFDVDLLRASEDGLELVAEGPVSLHVSYRVRPTPGGSEIDASISVEGHGLVGRVLAKATETLLPSGALRVSLERLTRELETARATRRSNEPAIPPFGLPASLKPRHFTQARQMSAARAERGGDDRSGGTVELADAWPRCLRSAGGGQIGCGLVDRRGRCERPSPATGTEC